MSSLIGHEHILNNLLDFAAKDRLSGSWIFSGVKGVGKAYTAKLLAQKLIGDNSANLKIIQRDYTDVEKKAIIKLIEDGKTLNPETEDKRERKAEITISDIRTLDEFTAFKSLDDTPKIVIIDSADEMNINAANGLLKTLEEPPSNTVIILISHQKKLLPTISSRCKTVKFVPIDDEVLHSYLTLEFSFVKDLDLIVKLSEGSIGRAHELIQKDGAALYNDIIDSLVIGKAPVGLGKDKIDLAFELLFIALARMVKHYYDPSDTLLLEVNAFDSLNKPAYKVMNLLSKSIEKYNKSKLIYLDKATILDSIFFNLKRLK